MRAVVKSLTSPDVADIAAYKPGQSAFLILLEIGAGPADELGYETFGVEICSIEWIRQELLQQAVINGRHRLMVKSFDWPAIVEYVNTYVAQCQGATWHEVASKIARLGKWEFEDYRT
jgi:hypothetical protein